MHKSFKKNISPETHLPKWVVSKNVCYRRRYWFQLLTGYGIYVYYSYIIKCEINLNIDKLIMFFIKIT